MHTDAHIHSGNTGGRVVKDQQKEIKNGIFACCGWGRCCFCCPLRLFLVISLGSFYGEEKMDEKKKYKIYVSKSLSNRKQHNVCFCHLDGKTFKGEFGECLQPQPQMQINRKIQLLFQETELLVSRERKYLFSNLSVYLLGRKVGQLIKI